NADAHGVNAGPLHSASAEGIAVTAGGFVGVGGVTATAHDGSLVQALVPDGVVLTAGGSIALLSSSYGAPDSTTPAGVAVAGIYSKGGSVAHATFDGTSL